MLPSSQTEIDLLLLFASPAPQTISPPNDSQRTSRLSVRGSPSSPNVPCVSRIRLIQDCIRFSTLRSSGMTSEVVKSPRHSSRVIMSSERRYTARLCFSFASNTRVFNDLPHVRERICGLFFPPGSKRTSSRGQFSIPLELQFGPLFFQCCLIDRCTPRPSRPDFLTWVFASTA